MSKPLNPLERAVIEAAQPVSETWRPYYFSHQDDGILAKGCKTRTFSTGARKGQLDYLVDQESKTVIVSNALLDKYTHLWKDYNEKVKHHRPLPEALNPNKSKREP